MYEHPINTLVSSVFHIWYDLWFCLSNFWKHIHQQICFVQKRDVNDFLQTLWNPILCSNKIILLMVNNYYIKMCCWLFFMGVSEYSYKSLNHLWMGIFWICDSIMLMWIDFQIFSFSIGAKQSSVKKLC